ncbi:MAG: hypothetical protein ACREFR_01460 [Limisphaerales bacterium]
MRFGDFRLIALAIAGEFAKTQLAAATSTNTTLGTILSLFGANSTA